MKIILESTTKLVHVNGVECRVWQGTTERGIPMFAFVVRVGLDRGADASEFERDLVERAQPSPEVSAIPHRILIE